MSILVPPTRLVLLGHAFPATQTVQHVQAHPLASAQVATKHFLSLRVGVASLLAARTSISTQRPRHASLAIPAVLAVQVPVQIAASLAQVLVKFCVGVLALQLTARALQVLSQVLEHAFQNL